MTTTKDQCIYIKKIEGRTILLLRQVDDFCTGCTEEQDAKNIYNLIGTKIQFQSEQEKGDVPFEYLVLVTDYNGTDLVQTKKYVEMNCSNYTSQFLSLMVGMLPLTSPTLLPLLSQTLKNGIAG